MAKRGESKCLQWLHDNARHADDDCLMWPFSRARGYGHYQVGGVHYYAHRVMCELANGPAPEDKPQVAHSCGRGGHGCVNPQHLRWASISDNMQERWRVHSPGSGNKYGYGGKLTEAQIAEIKSLKGIRTQDDLAIHYGVHRSTICYWHNLDRVRRAKPGTGRRSLRRRARAALISG